jgi:hypothetical protein
MADKYEELLNRLSNEIKDDDVRSIMKVVSRNRLYPKDCLNNGSLEQLLRKIIRYEERIEDLERRVTRWQDDK